MGSLFGGGGDYGAGGFKSDYNTTVAGERGLAGTLAGVGQGAGQDFSHFNSDFRGASDRYASYLKTDPYTDSYSTAKLNEANGDLTSNFLRAKASLTEDLARRGLAAPGANSSMLTGGLASIDAARAGTLSNNENNLALQKIALQRQNMGDLVNLEGGAANNAFGHEMGAYGAQGNLLGTVAGQDMSMYQSALQQQAARSQSIMNLIGGLGGAAITAYGG